MPKTKGTYSPRFSMSPLRKCDDSPEIRELRTTTMLAAHLIMAGRNMMARRKIFGSPCIVTRAQRRSNAIAMCLVGLGLFGPLRCGSHDTAATRLQMWPLAHRTGLAGCDFRCKALPGRRPAEGWVRRKQLVRCRGMRDAHDGGLTKRKTENHAKNKRGDECW